jgi:hypothetical protein
LRFHVPFEGDAHDAGDNVASVAVQDALEDRLRIDPVIGQDLRIGHVDVFSLERHAEVARDGEFKTNAAANLVRQLALVVGQADRRRVLNLADRVI